VLLTVRRLPPGYGPVVTSYMVVSPLVTGSYQTPL